MLPKIKFFETLSVFLQAYGQYKWKILIMACLGFVGGFLEGISIGAIIPLFSIVLGGGVNAEDPVSRLLSATFQYLPFRLNLPTLLTAMVVLFILKSVAILVFGNLRMRIITDFKKQMTKSMFSRALEATWPFLLKQKVGHIQHAFLRNIEQGSGLFVSFAQFILALTTFIMYFVIAVKISPVVTLLTLIAAGVFLVLVQPLGKVARRAAEKMNEAEKNTSHLISEHMIGMKIVKAAGTEWRVLEKAEKLLELLRKLNIRSNFLRNLSAAFIQPLSMVYIAGLFYFFSGTPGFSIAIFAATIFLVHKMFVNVETVQRSLHSMSDRIPYTADMIRLREEFLAHREDKGDGRPFKFVERLEFKNLKFSYTPDKPVFLGINLMVSRGEMVGLVGPSGAGKTSLVDLLLRFFQPRGGEILLDGVNIDNIDLLGWRKHIGYVSQDIFLLNDTIENNIRFYNAEVTMEEIVDVAKKANIHDFIKSLKDEYQTFVGDRGIMLSAGQRQRIVLARELVRRPEILILDEATSALDNESEALIQKSLESLRGKITIIIIAHRLSTVMGVDKIFVIQNGRIMEEGKPHALLENKDSYFSKMYHFKDSI